MKNVAAAVSFVAIPLGFASLASFWANKREDPPADTQKKGIDETVASIRSPYRVKYLYKTLETAAMILKLGASHIYDNMTQSQAEAFFSYLDDLELRCANKGDVEGPPIIVIEGLPGSGVSTLTDNLVEYTLAQRAMELPSALTAVAAILPKVPPALGHAYQCVCNYAKALQKDSAEYIIVERMYHSTCALTVCAEVDPSQLLPDLPPPTLPWPRDLPLPVLVLYLAVPPPQRISRLSRRGAAREGASDEAMQLHFQADARMQLAFSLVTGPPIVALDASGSAAEVLDTALQCLQQHGIILRDESSPPLPYPSGGEENITPLSPSHVKGHTKDDELYIADEDSFADNRASCRRSSFYGGRSNKRESMGIYGAMLKMDW